MRRYSESVAPRITLSMKIKKILMSISILLFCFNIQDCNGSKELHDDYYCDKPSGKISEVFRSLCEGFLKLLPCYYSKKYAYLEDWEVEVSRSLENQSIKLLPNEILYQIAVYLSPLDIINLNKSNKLFLSLKNNSFWAYYNKYHNYISWYEKVPEIKVAFSYYWFKNKKISKAASMGLPLAHELFIKQKKNERKNLEVNKNFIYLLDNKRPLYVWDYGRVHFSYIP